MKTIKTIFEGIEINTLEESVQLELKKIFKGDKEYDKLRAAAKKNSDDVPDFVDYVYNVIGDRGIEKMSKKYKMDMDVLVKSFLKEGFIAHGSGDDYEKLKKKTMKKFNVTNVNQLGRFDKQKYEDELDKAWKRR